MPPSAVYRDLWRTPLSHSLCFRALPPLPSQLRCLTLLALAEKPFSIPNQVATPVPQDEPRPTYRIHNQNILSCAKADENGSMSNVGHESSLKPHHLCACPPSSVLHSRMLGCLLASLSLAQYFLINPAVPMLPLRRCTSLSPCLKEHVQA